MEMESSLNELNRLVTTLGYRVVGKVTQKRNSDRSPSVLGEGKLIELARYTSGSGIIASAVDRKKSKAAQKWEKNNDTDQNDQSAEENNDNDSDVENIDENEETEDSLSGIESTSEIKEPASIVIVDCDLSPSQLRNLESATGVTVFDRTGVIIEIFSRHARTKAARLQVEIARLTYLAPRLRETGGSADRQGGGIGSKGSGETSLELDKRRIRDRIKELKDELESIGDEHQLRRVRREQELSVALVGYTNAGKSSLMRAMTGSDILVADKLFATLDTTVRPIHPETVPKILLSDTVGFIKKLPHDLVASFKSTLDEALHASLLLFVVDSSDPSFRSQLEVTQSVLSEVGATEVPRLLILNKQDCLSEDEKKNLLLEFPDAILLSTKDPNDLKILREKILSYFEKDMIESDIFVPYGSKNIIGEIRSRSRVISESHNETGTLFKVRTNQDTLNFLLDRAKPTKY